MTGTGNVVELIKWLDYTLFPVSVLATIAALWLIQMLSEQKRAVYDPAAPTPSTPSQRANADYHLGNACLMLTTATIMAFLSASLFFPLFDGINDVVTRMFVIRVALDLFILIVMVKIWLCWLYWRQIRSLERRRIEDGRGNGQ